MEYALAKHCILSFCSGPFLLYWVGLPPVVLGPNILSKGVETGLVTTQSGPACAQTLPHLPKARLRQAKLF